jgi:glycosidase
MQTPNWTKDAFFYHIYPLGLLDAPVDNQFHLPPEPRLKNLYPWLDHLQWLGVNALYLGPLFQSGRHGYDTSDYFLVDRRLGSNQDMKELADEIHRRGMRLILDGVFNHTGRSFWAFRDIQVNGQASAYTGWYEGLRFDEHNSSGDPFTYQNWAGHDSLPKLNLTNPDVRNHLLAAVQFWMDEWEIDGLRLDAADCIDINFWQELRRFTERINPEFWLMGEIIHGDYSQWANPQTLHATTNYEGYKGLWSSLNDANYFEIAYALNRQFGKHGIYKDLNLYNFADNHDVNRAASQLLNPAHLFPLYALLFTMPGIPSIYYGSEWGIKGKRTEQNDLELRPAINLHHYIQAAPEPQLPQTIRDLANLRRDLPAIRYGDYRQESVSAQQLVFWRSYAGQNVLVAINSSAQPVDLKGIKVPQHQQAHTVWPHPYPLQTNNGTLDASIPACGLMVFSFEA